MKERIKAIIAELVERATVDWDIDEERVSVVNILPVRPGACKFSVAWSMHEIVVGFEGKARIELGPGDDDLPRLRQIVSAIVAGRVTRTGGKKGGSYRLALEDGSVILADGTLLARLGPRREVPCEPY